MRIFIVQVNKIAEFLNFLDSGESAQVTYHCDKDGKESYLVFSVDLEGVELDPEDWYEEVKAAE
jgi:hypothetical protein